MEKSGIDKLREATKEISAVMRNAADMLDRLAATLGEEPLVLPSFDAALSFMDNGNYYWVERKYGSCDFMQYKGTTEYIARAIPFPFLLHLPGRSFFNEESFDNSDYNHTWRVWRGEPTNQQRKDEPWYEA